MLTLLAAAALYLDPSQPTAQRVADLLSRMTPAEKMSQLGHESPGIERLKVAPYNWSNECLHGVAAPGISTVFPQAIGLAAAWNEPLHQHIASVIGDETRAHNNEFVRRGNYSVHTGLTCWSPNINIFRDPRWGRGQETYGEDPYLTARLGVAFVKGLQGDNPRYLKTIATPKHYAVHSGPESQRHSFDAPASDRDLAETYLPAFEATIREGGAQSVMCAYNRLRGEPACSSGLLLQDILRGRWGFNGYVVSDCGAIGDISGGHAVAPDLVHAAARGFNAGTDIACGSEYGAIPDAVKAGLVKMARVDEALTRLFRARFQLGEFDPASMVPYRQLPTSIIDSPQHDQLALQAARESMVLLKNDKGALPWKKNLRSIAVIGPNAHNVDVLLGNYNGTPSHPVTLLDGIRRKLGSQVTVRYARGSALAPGLEAPAAPAAWFFHDENGKREPGLVGEFYSGMKLAGAPVSRRTDTTVNIDFQKLPPPAPLTGENFSARWTGWLVPPATGEYVLGTYSDDGSRLYLDNELVVDQWSDHAPMTQTVRRRLQAGQAYAVRLEYYQNKGGAVVSLLGSFGDDQQQIAEAVAAARASDAVVLALGLSPLLEGEEMPVQVPGFFAGDRTDIELPSTQAKLLQAVMAVGKPSVLVLLNGSALAVNWAAANVPAILEAWYPGQRGGDAIADVLFGDYNPAGRLPVTFYRSAADLPPFENYGMDGRTYRYFTGTPLYKFGHGLSYTKFAYRNLKVTHAAGQSKVTVSVSNVGSRAGDEVVELYVSRQHPELKGFRRIPLAPGESRSVEFTIPDPGAGATISVGGGQPGTPGAVTWRT